jgi:uncharacterized repeat protein (TIGR01451 family)
MFIHRTAIRVFALACLSVALLALPAQAATTLTIQPITWNITGLDSNTPATGPNRFPVGARVCSSVATTNVSVAFTWDSANAFVALRAGSLSVINIPSIGAGGCADAYFEVEIQKVAAAFDTTRRYHLTATDVSGSISTTTPREIYVEHLISQNRNSVTDVKYGPNPLSLTSVPAGGSMSLVVGNTYTIQLLGGTATQGYNQFEAFINFPNTIFQVLDVETTYSANNSPYVTGPAPAIHDQLYADSCRWENDPNSPNYRSCVGGDFKSGGSNVVTTYTIKIIGGGGTSESLTTLLYDFSGSSFHYNADYATGARVANIIDPTTADISKAFNPNPAAINGVSVLTITLTNPNPGVLGGYNFVDNLPANLQVSATAGATTSGCGAATLTAIAGASSISFSNGTLAANSNCIIRVNVTPTATGTLNNTTQHLFIDTVDTGKTGSASLTVNTDVPGTGLCGVTLAGWSVPTGTTANPPDLAGGIPTVKAANVATATAVAGVPADSSIIASSGHGDTTSWRTWGYKNDGQTLDFTVNTSNYTAVQMSFWVANPSPANGPTSMTVRYNSGAGFSAPILTVANPVAGFTQHTINFTGLTSITGNTVFRIAATGANADSSGASLNFDDIVFTGCTTAIDPTISKNFAPDPIAVNGTSALTGAKFTDTLPTGLQVAATPAASTTCGGGPTWAPTAGVTVLNFGQVTGATIPASGSCTVTVNVTSTTGGAHSNVSGFLFTTETGTANGGVATDTLTAVLPPSISKLFAPSPILAGGTSTLTFTITNPNQDNAISGVAFSDTFPVAPGAMTVAAVPSASTTGCGAPAFTAVANAGSVSFTGGSIAAGGTCTVKVNVTAPATGTYNNTSGNVSHLVNAVAVNGNTASASLTVNPPSPSISLLKQVGLSPTGPWVTFLPISSGPVYYRFTVENTGDVPLSPVSISDNTLNVASCNGGFPATLPVAVAANDNHIATCVVGPVATTSGLHVNTATASGTYSGTPYPSDPSSATYATTGLTLDKTAAESTYTVAGNQLNYSYLVTNSGFATLQGPVTVADNKVTVTCPSLTTVGDLDNFLDPGESITCTATYIITASDVSAGFVTNTATATVESVNSNTDSVTIVSSTSADVSIVKTLVTAGPYTAGQSITYTLLIANAGPSTATSVQVTDVPSNLNITNVSGSGCAALPCTIPSIASGANTSVTVTATITAAGAFDNSASANGTQPDPVPANNTDNTGNGGSAAPSADVSIVKTLVTAGPYTIGQSITYSLLVANAGPSTATSVQVTDVPSNLSITGVSGSGCAALPCTIPSIASGANTSITVTATILAAGAFDNTASANGAESDPVPANNTDNTGNGGIAAASADVSIVKTLNTAGPFTIGQSITYTLLIANAGPSIATSVQVTDTPSNLSITGVSGSGCAALPCTIPSIAVGANTSITVTATITAAGAFDNSASANGTEPDPVPANNTDNTGNGGSAAASADVSIVKTLNTAGPFTIGQSITYTLLIANAGPSIATSVQVTDTPSNLSITGVSGSGCAALPCTIPSIAVGANTSITVTATITAAGAFDNTASANGTEPDPVPANNTDNTGNGGIAAASADVSIVKSLVTAGPYSIGQTITYTLLIANAGPSIATSVQVTDTPSNLSITGVSGSGCAALPCTIPSIAVGANASITVTATITAVGAFDNSASANATEPDPVPANNTDNTGNGGNAAASADVSIVKTLVTAGPYTIGQTISYTLLIANAGPSIATSVQVTDTPSNLSITGVSGSGCAALPCTIPSIAVGANTSITVTATITASGAFDNSASANATEPDPNSANNTDNTGNGGSADTSADISVVKTLVTAGPYTIGQSITYTLLIANAGPSIATSVQVTDTPTNLTITNVSGSGCAALPCTIPSIAVGANTSITVTATIVAAGAFDNSATVTGLETDPVPANNTDNTGNGGVAAASADVSIVKSLVTAGPYTIGQTISYTLLIANAGPSIATAVQVTDTPSNLSITGVSGSGCAALPCTIPSIAVGANTSITVTATITAAGAFDNTASANGVEPDPVPANNTDNTGNGGVAAASADVSIVKSLVTAGPYSIGQTITYTLLIANAGPSIATSVQVTDTPSNLSITGVSGSGCAALPCTIPSIAVGANTSITVTATITASGAFDNSASANGTEPDPVPANNTDNTGNGGSADTSADISVVKTLVTAGPYTIGQSITYTLLIANAGPSIATSVQVTDTPSNLTITNVSGSGCAALPCTIPSIGVGANTSVTVTATIVAAGAFDNSATVTGLETDPVPANNTDNTGNGGVAAASADVSTVKTLNTAGPYTIGQTITYTLLIANAGPSIATSVQVTDTPSNLSITGVSGSGCAALPCTIPSIAVGANTSITVTATIVASGAFDNTATANATQPDPVPANNTDSTGNGGNAAASADVSIVKTLVTAGPFTVGQSVSYTLLVANAGPSTATSVQVTDTPSNLTITNVSGSGCAALPCTIPSITVGANTSITVTATINGSGTFDNTATANAIESDPVPANNTDSTGNSGSAGTSADVSIVKTLDSAGPFTVGQSITYTLLIANAGPSVATSIQVADVPTNLSVTNVSGSGCAALPCTIASLAVGANTSITVTATIAAGGAFDNNATATALEPDPDPSDNTDTTGNGGQAIASADVSLVKTLTASGPYSVGQSITYSLFVANAGPSPATAIQVTDTPSNLTITNVTGGGCAALPCTISSLAVGANTTITVTATIVAAGPFDNVAAAHAVELDPNESNNSDAVGNNGVTGPSADVSLVKTLTTAGPFTAGQSVTYTLVIANAGPSVATSIQVTDTPSNLTITNVSGGGCAALPCTIPSLAVGANTTITVVATITAAGAFDNVATATAIEPDPNPANNTDADGNNGLTGVSADVSLVKTLTTAGPFIHGQSITYTLFIANAGPSPATSIQVTDTPANLSITSVTGGGCAALPCTIPSLAVGANTTITVVATISAAGAFDNVATGIAVEADPNLVNNTDSAGNNGVAAPSVDLAITKTSVSTIAIGQNFDFLLVVDNNGPDTATGVVMTDPLPANFQLASVTTSQGTCSGTATITCTIGTMLSGATVTITIRGSATATGQMTNIAAVDANETEAVLTNNSSSAGPAVNAAAVNDIPTVTELGLLILAILLAFAGARMIRPS